MDSAWEQKKPEARKMLENGDKFHTSIARFVSPYFAIKLLMCIYGYNT